MAKRGLPRNSGGRSIKRIHAYLVHFTAQRHVRIHMGPGERRWENLRAPGPKEGRKKMGPKRLKMASGQMVPVTDADHAKVTKLRRKWGAESQLFLDVTDKPFIVFAAYGSIRATIPIHSTRGLK